MFDHPDFSDGQPVVVLLFKGPERILGFIDV